VLRVANRSLRVDGTASRHTSAGVKTASYAYDPYGRTRTATGPNAASNAFRYAGGLFNTTTGATKFGARYYDPNTGRFTQPDPSGQEHNPYSYARNTPTTYYDPSGFGIDFWDAAGALLVTGIVSTAVSGLFGPEAGLAVAAPVFEAAVNLEEGEDPTDIFAPFIPDGEG
jgi:RHS repeat-associated protein